jgi:Uma2 family endonuclease
MLAMVSRTTDAPVPLGEYVPTADTRIVMWSMSWTAYQSLLALRGERRRPKLAYLDGALEIMTTSRHHEHIRAVIGRLVEAYCTERRIPWSPYGTWTQQDESEEAGVEPDECYIIDQDPKRKDRPDLAIEVAWTTGGIEKLDIYHRLRIGEVWIWKNDAITVHVLGPDGYEVRAESVCVPGIDLQLVCRLVPVEPTSEVVAQFLAALGNG